MTPATIEVFRDGLSVLEDRIRGCRECDAILAGYGIEPRPVFSGGGGYPIFLIGQAPGKTEYERRAPFQGEAGRSIKAHFSACGLSSFDLNVYQTSVTKCFPGRRVGSSTDRVPSVKEVLNCKPFLERQLDFVKPRLIVCLGSLSWRAIFSMQEVVDPGFCMRELGIIKPSDVKTAHVVGRQFYFRSAIVVPMIHPAGSANGARSLYAAQDKESKRLLAHAITELGLN